MIKSFFEFYRINSILLSYSLGKRSLMVSSEDVYINSRKHKIALERLFPYILEIWYHFVHLIYLIYQVLLLQCYKHDTKVAKVSKVLKKNNNRSNFESIAVISFAAISDSSFFLSSYNIRFHEDVGNDE